VRICKIYYIYESKYVRICSWARETALKVQLNDVIGALTAMPTAIDFDSLDFRSGWNMSVPNISDTFATFPAMWADDNDHNDSSGVCVSLCVCVCVSLMMMMTSRVMQIPESFKWNALARPFFFWEYADPAM